jgi:hypothetical protein
MSKFLQNLLGYAQVAKLLQTLSQQLGALMSALDDLKAQVAANTTVAQSAVTLIQGLKQKLDDAIASGDPAALKALSDQLATDDAALAAAVTANTLAASSPSTPTV